MNSIIFITLWSIFAVVVATIKLQKRRKQDGISRDNRNTTTDNLSTNSGDSAEIVRARVYTRRDADRKHMSDLRKKLRSMKKTNGNSEEFSQLQLKYYESLRMDNVVSKTFDSGNTDTLGKMVPAHDDNTNTSRDNESQTGDECEKLVRARVYSRRDANLKFIRESQKHLPNMKKKCAKSDDLILISYYNRMTSKYHDSLRH